MPKAIPAWRPPRPKMRPTKERAHYVSADWKLRRKAVLVRDAYVCRSCGRIAVELPQVDHIVPLEDGGSDSMDNLQTLCVRCHGRKTINEQRRRGQI